MNAEAILTPGGIADQLTRGLSGLGQSFNDREEMLRRGQRDRIGDDRYTAEMALRQQAQARQDARQALMDRRQEMQDRHLSAREALADQRYGDERAVAQEERARRNADLELQRQSQHPELYTGSPSPQIARSAQEALARRQFQDAKAGYIPADQQEVMPGQDWRVPMRPDAPVYGPRPGSPAWQGSAAARSLVKPNHYLTPEQREAEIKLKQEGRDAEAERARQFAEKQSRIKQLLKDIAAEKRRNEDQVGQSLKETGMTLDGQKGLGWSGWHPTYASDEAAAQIVAKRKASLASDPARLQNLREMEQELRALQGAPAAPAAADGASENMEDAIVRGAPTFKP